MYYFLTDELQISNSQKQALEDKLQGTLSYTHYNMVSVTILAQKFKPSLKVKIKRLTQS